MSARCPRRVPIAVRRPQAKAPLRAVGPNAGGRLLIVSGTSEEHTSELQSPDHLVSRLLLEKKIPVFPSQCFDGRGNYTLGIRNHFIFPEIDITNAAHTTRLTTPISTNAKTTHQPLYPLPCV